MRDLFHQPREGVVPNKTKVPRGLENTGNSGKPVKGSLAGLWENPVLIHSRQPSGPRPASRIVRENGRTILLHQAPENAGAGASSGDFASAALTLLGFFVELRSATMRWGATWNDSTAVHRLWRYNFVPEIGSFRRAFTPGRFYAMPDEAGLVRCTWPKGGLREDFKKHWQYACFNACMSGFEWQVAAHMVQEGAAIHRTEFKAPFTAPVDRLPLAISRKTTLAWTE